MRTALPTCGLRPPPPTRLHRLLRSEEEEGSEEGEGSDEEHVEATPAPRSSAKKAKPKSTTPASRKAASRRSSMADEDLLDEGVELAATSLVDCYEQLVSAPVRVGQPSMLLSMSLDKWSQLYTADAARAIVDVLNLFLRVCGLPESRLDLADVDAVRAPPCPCPRISAPAPAPPTRARRALLAPLPCRRVRGRAGAERRVQWLGGREPRERDDRRDIGDGRAVLE